MHLTQKEFSKRLKGHELSLALIGMSNIGKSFRARQLAGEKDFSLLTADEEIAKRLKLRGGVEGLARWMGPPYDPGYVRAEEAYLAAEAETIENIQIPTAKNFVLDTTGSVIYLDPPLLDSLKERFLIVHLDLSSGMFEKMTELFFIHPKPVIWHGMFQMRPKESPEVAFRRCYPSWIKFRLKKYRELADVSISGEYARNKGFTCDQFLEAIGSAL